MGSNNNFTHSIFVHEEEVESRKELGVETSWRENYRACWSIFGAYLELKIKESGCQA
jgi:hypothetical protein